MTTDLPRREFLQHLSSGIAGAVYLTPVSAFAILNKSTGFPHDILSFTEVEGLGPQIDVDLIDKTHVALHEERQLPENLVDGSHNNYVAWLLRQMVEKQGLQWDESDSLLWTYQHYGFCDHSDQCSRLMSYATSAQDFLYNSVRGLLDIDINWHMLDSDFEHAAPQHKHFKGIVGRHTYLVHRVNLQDTEGNLKDYGLVTATSVNRAINYITSANNKPSSSLMYIIPGNTSLVSPFAELLHLTTHGPSRKLARQLEKQQGKVQAEETSHTIGETITESAAIVVAQKYLKKFGQDHRMKLVNAHARNLGGRLSLIPDTISYMKRHSVQHALNTFAEDPLQLVNEISNTYIAT